eukprot:6196418-Pleurochrysis_carterae.AAC.3
MGAAYVTTLCKAGSTLCTRTFVLSHTQHNCVSITSSRSTGCLQIGFECSLQSSRASEGCIASCPGEAAAIGVKVYADGEGAIAGINATDGNMLKWHPKASNMQPILTSRTDAAAADILQNMWHLLKPSMSGRGAYVHSRVRRSFGPLCARRAETPQRLRQHNATSTRLGTYNKIVSE